MRRVPCGYAYMPPRVGADRAAVTEDEQRFAVVRVDGSVDAKAPGRGTSVTPAPSRGPDLDGQEGSAPG
ncbi:MULTISPECIES: hypothetical protein [unclassified Streptomyces]|uniref:hypothetical protein n=1 Tax=unclassified Streptomyces TaxID=2593676 RepID=UPI00380FC00B